MPWSVGARVLILRPQWAHGRGPRRGRSACSAFWLPTAGPRPAGELQEDHEKSWINASFSPRLPPALRLYGGWADESVTFSREQLTNSSRSNNPE
eukprot:3375098-Prymnesium_polylepis.1